MIIYHETKSRFIEDVDQNVIHARLVDAFRSKTGSIPADERVWADEYSRFSLALRQANVAGDIQVAIEYHISAAGRFRVDVLLAGTDGQTDNALIVELKAWDKAGLSEYQDMVFAPIAGGSVKEHPCIQANKYKGLILRFNQDVREHLVKLHSAAYLFNLHRRDPEPLEDARYQHILKESKLFLADDVKHLCRFMEKVIPKKPSRDVIYLIENGKLVPSPELISRVSSMLDGNEEFELIDEQNEAFQIIRHGILQEPVALKQRHVFVIEGGPGTGKSVIAVRLLAEVLKAKRLGFFVAPNRAFRETIIEFLARGNRGYREDGDALFKSSWSFHDADFQKQARNDVLIVDEAHRLKERAYQYKGKSMVEDMVRAARVSVFFIDETQRVQWDDIGSVAVIREAATKFGAEFHAPMKLLAQYRCGGSSGYLNWLDDVLQIRATANFDNWGAGEYEFKVFDRAEELYAALRAKNGDNKARLIAGYAWEWPTQGRERGSVIQHVKADGLSLPWNYDGENWATSADGIGQAGCIHTSQGIEFDWLGVLIGADLSFKDGLVVGDPLKRAKTDKSLQGWKRDLEAAGDNPDLQQAVLDKIQSIVKSTYKVLLSRGRKGCYVWCADPQLREYFKQRLSLVSQPSGKANQCGLSLVQDPADLKFIEYLPVYSLEIAAGPFGRPSDSECLGWVKSLPGFRVNDRHFVAQVTGKSMEPLIRDGSHCVFRFGVEGTRVGRIVLAQKSGALDPESGGSYTVKKYASQKIQDGEGGWRHVAIKLLPLNPDFEPINIPPDDAEDLMIVAEYVGPYSP